mmetsp:Transcript_2780/g.4483  ORF Transcript_2780/g.4483 Transcript_2780/m.4483 type:complete len:108 (+) Transcript_2780:956-1279(+)
MLLHSFLPTALALPNVFLLNASVEFLSMKTAPLSIALFSVKQVKDIPTVAPLMPATTPKRESSCLFISSTVTAWPSFCQFNAFWQHRFGWFHFTIVQYIHTDRVAVD